MNSLVGEGRLVAERRVAPPRVVPAFDVLEELAPRLGRRPEGLAVEQLTLEGREEALAQGIVVGVADRAIDGRTPKRSQRCP
jgi:hypothetical protein